MAARFWVGGTGTWDGSDTTHWASSSGGAGGQSVPGSSDTVTLDGSSGGGTVTVNTTVTVQSITMGAFTGTLDFATNNNNVTLSGSSGVSFSGTGSGTRTLNLGNGTWTLTGVGAQGTMWNMGTTTNLTFNANSSTIVIGTTSTAKTFAGGGLTYHNVTFTGGTLATLGSTTISGANTFNAITVGAPNYFVLTNSITQTVNTALTVTGTSSNQVGFSSSVPSTSATLALAASSTFEWTAFRDITFTGSPTATNSFNLGRNSGITITVPSTSGGGARVIGG